MSFTEVFCSGVLSPNSPKVTMFDQTKCMHVNSHVFGKNSHLFKT